MNQSLEATQDTTLGSLVDTSMLESRQPLLTEVPSPTEEFSPSLIPLPTGVTTPSDAMSDHEVSTAAGQDTIVDTALGSNAVLTRKPKVIVVNGYPASGKWTYAKKLAENMSKYYHVYAQRSNSMISFIDEINMGRKADAYAHAARRNMTQGNLNAFIETAEETEKPKTYIFVETHCVYRDNEKIAKFQEAAPLLYSNFANSIDADFHPITIYCTEADSRERLPEVPRKTKVSTAEEVKNWRKKSYVFDYGEAAPNRKTIDTSGTTPEEGAKFLVDHFRNIGVIPTEA